MYSGDIFEASAWPQERFPCLCGRIIGVEDEIDCEECGAVYERRGDEMVMVDTPAGGIDRWA